MKRDARRHDIRVRIGKVYKLYCIDKKTIKQIAKELEYSKSTIWADLFNMRLTDHQRRHHA